MVKAIKNLYFLISFLVIVVVVVMTPYSCRLLHITYHVNVVK